MNNLEINNTPDDDLLSIRVCTVCNKRCSYCALLSMNVYTEYNDKFDSNKLKLLDDYELTRYDRIHIQGGELGLLSKEELDLIFNYFTNKNVLDNKLYIFTNGLLFDKYLEEFEKHNYWFLYHVIDFDSFVDYSKYNINFFNIYVVHNYECLEDFEKLLKTYSEYKFDMIIDVNLGFKIISDKFFNKLKYLVDTYSNITIDQTEMSHGDFKKNMFENKKKFIVTNGILTNMKINKDLGFIPDFIKLY
jgi:hypothetical protein